MRVQPAEESASNVAGKEPTSPPQQEGGQGPKKATGLKPLLACHPFPEKVLGHEQSPDKNPQFNKCYFV